MPLNTLQDLSIPLPLPSQINFILTSPFTGFYRDLPLDTGNFVGYSLSFFCGSFGPDGGVCVWWGGAAGECGGAFTKGVDWDFFSLCL